MNTRAKRLKKTIKLHWIKILVAVLGVVFLTVFIILLIVGLRNFFSLESFYKRQFLSVIPFQIFISIVTGFVFVIFYSFMYMWLFFGGGFAKLSQKKIKEKEVDVKWSDVIGMESVKLEISEVIKLLKDRAQLKRIGGKVIKGVLMVGPPGCGKTYLAKAIATETGLPFLPSVGSEFVGIFVGLGAMRIKSLFKQARTLADINGGCIVFIDEIDSIARPRVGVSGFGGGISHNATINQLLSELDGLRQEESNIVIIAATNVNEEELDPALMRAGRFDRKVYVDYPQLEDRKNLFKYYLDKTKYDPDIDVAVLARKTVYFSPADISNMVREASLIAVRNNREITIMKDLSEAYDRVEFGFKSGLLLSEKEKVWVAYHEAGHAIIAYLMHPTTDVVKASIIPRKGFLGYAHPVPREEIHIDTKNQLLASIKTSLASYVAEKLKFGSTGSGVNTDFSNALKTAHNMVYRWGMGETGILGNFYTPGIFHPTYGLTVSEKIRQKLDEDVQKILSSCLKEVEEILTKEKDLLEYFARELLKKEELEYDEIVEIFKKHGKERPQSSAS
ncbi:MAG: AAA family ATPase [Candidatus Omnitrophota bacterium]|nr:MAG: AAA family ATPase [Candidatus Omnitrophota bacterium]